jgi:CO dehydrogenase nickel-insertion accessory protein CooC1
MAGKILAVWGAPGSGKSVVAAKLACSLAKRGGVVLVFCGAAAPMLPCVCAEGELERRRSLGSVFAVRSVSVSLVRNNLTTLRGSETLRLLGFQRGEYGYPACSERLGAELIAALRELAEFAVVDCDSGLDGLTMAALGGADTVLRLVSGELKSLSYFASRLPEFRERLPTLDAQLRVANAVRPLSAWERAGSALSRTDFRLPYSAELGRQVADGKLLVPLKSQNGRAFDNALRKIETEVKCEN